MESNQHHNKGLQQDYNEGHIVIPPIFPKDVQTGIDEEAANESWREYQKYAADSVSDAFDGEPDAYWNID